MKYVASFILALLLCTAHAQETAAIDLHLKEAGDHLIKSGKDRTAAIVSFLVGAAVGGYAAHLESKKGDPNYLVPAAIGGMGLCVSIGFDLSSAGHLRKAGRAFQR